MGYVLPETGPGWEVMVVARHLGSFHLLSGQRCQKYDSDIASCMAMRCVSANVPWLIREFLKLTIAYLQNDDVCMRIHTNMLA